MISWEGLVVLLVVQMINLWQIFPEHVLTFRYSVAILIFHQLTIYYFYSFLYIFQILILLELFQNQVENLQASLATVVRYVSERSRHSSSSTPPGVHSVHSVHQGLPNSMTMSLPPSLTLPNPVTISRSCDSLAQVQCRVHQQIL